MIIYIVKVNGIRVQINIEQLIEIIVREVLKELTKRGESLDFSTKEAANAVKINSKKKQCIVFDMSKYKTPLLTEDDIRSVDQAVEEITIPKGTIITPGAKDIIRKRNLKLNYNL